MEVLGFQEHCVILFYYSDKGFLSTVAPPPLSSVRLPVQPISAPGQPTYTPQPPPKFSYNLTVPRSKSSLSPSPKILTTPPTIPTQRPFTNYSGESGHAITTTTRVPDFCMRMVRDE